MQNFVRKLQSLVAANRSKLSLAVLTDYLSDKIPDLHSQALLLQANLAQAEQDFASGVATRAEVQQQLAKVNAGLLYLIRDASLLLGDETAAMKRAKQIEKTFKEHEFTLQSPSNRVPVFWVIGLGAIVFAGFMGWYALQTPEKAALPSAPAVEQIQRPVKSLAAQKTEYEAWRQQAKNLAKQGQWQKALETVNNAFGLGFDNDELLNQRADIYLHLARYAEARGDARKAIALNPEYCDSYVSLAQAQAKLGDVEDFYRNVETALRKRCEVWDYTQQIGLSDFRNQPRFKKLLARFRK